MDCVSYFTLVLVYVSAIKLNKWLWKRNGACNLFSALTIFMQLAVHLYTEKALANQNQCGPIATI